MSHRLARRDPPRYDHWPEAVRSAELLRGALVRCGPALRGAGWPECPEVRLRAITGVIGPGRVAIGTTAAWVWGALREPCAPLEAAMPDRRRPPHEHRPGVRTRQLRIDQEDIVALGGATVTSRLRTVLDLLRSEESLDPRVRVAVRLLALTVPGGRDRIAEVLRAGPRSGSIRALARCAEL
ncbi:hypothetical protein JD292_03760 [Leucobacter sp. CSA2]|uniref:AbiEi antitoxin C-terminal domain-containing protein n=1 Tax=Leucobacter edaphi TaxID=2796472 RepID=A0A934QBN5_9MICO|nr:hypothetical protein [Leucobacter edaphi]MBK0421198.1 hypothetical protein [Leucobacter edaphi]